MMVTSEICNILIREIPNYQKPEAYASGMALSSIWEDWPNDNATDERFQILLELYQVATMSVRDLAQKAGMSQRALAQRFCIPLRTLESWCASQDSPSRRDCPLYLRLMMAECLGLLPVEIKK